MSPADAIDEYVAAANAEMNRQKEIFLRRNLRSLPPETWEHFELLEGPLDVREEAGTILFRQTVVLRRKSVNAKQAGYELASSAVSTAVRPTDIVNAIQEQESAAPTESFPVPEPVMRRRFWVPVGPSFLFGALVGLAVGTWAMWLVSHLPS